MSSTFWSGTRNWTIFLASPATDRKYKCIPAKTNGVNSDVIEKQMAIAKAMNTTRQESDRRNPVAWDMDKSFA